MSAEDEVRKLSAMTDAVQGKAEDLSVRADRLEGWIDENFPFLPNALATLGEVTSRLFVRLRENYGDETAKFLLGGYIDTLKDTL